MLFYVIGIPLVAALVLAYFVFLAYNHGKDLRKASDHTRVFLTEEDDGAQIRQECLFSKFFWMGYNKKIV